MPPSFALLSVGAMPLPSPHTKNNSCSSHIYIYTCARACMCTKKLLSSHHHKKPSHLRREGSMGQANGKAKQGGEQATPKTEKGGKVVHKSKDVDDLIEFMRENYDKTFESVKTFDEFYHAIYDIIEQFCQKRGQLQYKIPSREDLEKAYEKAHSNCKKGENLNKEQFTSLTEEILTVDSFTFGKAAREVLLVLFGAPVCALLAKRVIPGLKSFSEDVVIPVATSGAVVYLAKANKL